MLSGPRILEFHSSAQWIISRYKWRGFRTQAWDFEEGWRLLNDAWREQQERHAIVSQRAGRRKEAALHAAADDMCRRPGALVTLTDPQYKEVFHGRMTEEGRSVVFVEEGTWVRVSVEVPERFDGNMRQGITWRDKQLYYALRGEHARAKKKASREASRAARQKAAADQMPKTPGDLAVKQRKETGHLIYAWKGFEVSVTPRDLRPDLPEHSSAWKAARARETTPQRALRKVKEKISRSLKKLARGEHEAIVAREDRSEATSPAGGTAERVGCAAIAKLDDPTVLQELKTALAFLASARLCRFWTYEHIPWRHPPKNSVDPAVSLL